jgi:hypothetical protein
MAGSDTAVFFLSTGRCGTQWLQKALAATYSDVAVVTHEPVRGAYAPKRYLRAYDRLHELLASGDVSMHLSFIRETLRSRSYIETGWPCYPALPLFIEQLQGQVRIVHLVRHPVHVALSLVTHKVYDQRTDWVAGAALSPFDEGVAQKELRHQWAKMGAYEKCLFWWTEINLYALELQERHPDIAFSFLRYEDLFDRETPALQNLIRFLNLPDVPSIQNFRDERVDRWHWQSSSVDWKRIFDYPRTVALAERFGYDVATFSPAGIATRYFG